MPNAVRSAIGRRVAPVLCILAIVAVTGCDATGQQDEAAVGYSVRDSAGVQVFANVSSAWTSTHAWLLAPTPDVVIAFEDATLTGPTDVAGATRLTSGHIVVASAQAVRLEQFDAHGRSVRTVGRRGKGPGEFNAIRQLWRTRGDSLLIFEGGMTRQFVLFDSAGHFARSWGAFGVDSSTHYLIPVAPLADGGIAMRTMNVITPALTAVDERPSTNLVVFDGQWRLVRRLGRFPDTKRFRGPGLMQAELFFSADTRFAFGTTRWYAGDSENAVIRVYTHSDPLIRILHWPARHAVVRPEHIAREQDRRIAFFRDLYSNVGPLQRQMIDGALRPMFRQMPYPDRFPDFGELIVDPDENLWAVEYPRIGEEGSSGLRIEVFDTTGRWLGRVQLPARFQPLDIGRDYMLGVRTDDLDVPRVELYRLIKPEVTP